MWKFKPANAKEKKELELVAPMLDDSSMIRQKISQLMQGWVQSKNNDGSIKHSIGVIALKYQFEPNLPMLKLSRMLEEFNLVNAKIQLLGKILDRQNNEDGDDLGSFIHEMTCHDAMYQNDPITFHEAWTKVRRGMSEVNAIKDPEKWQLSFNKVVLITLKSLISSKCNSSMKTDWILGQLERTVDLILRFNTDVEMASVFKFIHFNERSRQVEMVFEAIAGMAKRVMIMLEKRESENDDLNQYLLKSTSVFMKTENVNATLVVVTYGMVDSENDNQIGALMDRVSASINSSITNQQEIQNNEDSLSYSPETWRLRIRRRPLGRGDLVTNQIKTPKKRPSNESPELRPINKKKKMSGGRDNCELMPTRLFEDGQEEDNSYQE